MPIVWKELQEEISSLDTYDRELLGDILLGDVNSYRTLQKQMDTAYETDYSLQLAATFTNIQRLVSELPPLTT